MRVIRIVPWAFLLVTFFFTAAHGQPLTTVPAKERCPVCGMFVAKYEQWIAQVQMADGTTRMFDGVKDMMVFYFHPEKYGGSEQIRSIYVKDYYSQQYVDGKTAKYVTGSDVMGPMGHELIPFSSTEAAKAFRKDHHGKTILSFDQIDAQLIENMRSGKHGKGMHKMQHSN